MSKALQTQERIQKMEADLKAAKEELAVISEYIQERIRIDKITDGFQKGYAQRIVIGNNTEILLALWRLEALL